MHVGGQPDDVVQAMALDLAEQPGDLELTAARRAVVAVGGEQASMKLTIGMRATVFLPRRGPPRRVPKSNVELGQG